MAAHIEAVRCAELVYFRNVIALQVCKDVVPRAFDDIRDGGPLPKPSCGDDGSRKGLGVGEDQETATVQAWKVKSFRACHDITSHRQEVPI